MSDGNEAQPAGQPVDPQSIVTEIAYCPCLDLYHYKRNDGADYFFDTPQLEKSIDAYVHQGMSRDADFMSVLTGMARQFPHKRVKFDANAQCNITDLEKAEVAVVGGAGGEKTG